MPDTVAERKGGQPSTEWRSFLFWFLFASLVVFHLVANVWWQALDIRPVRTDEEVHMQTARDYYVAFTERPKQDNPLKLLIDVASVRPGNPVHPPLLHMLGALMILVRGYSLDTISLTVTWLFLLAMPGCYLIARRFLGPWQALFATFVFSFTPIIYGSSRWFMTDFLSMTIVVWAVYALLRTDYFHNTLWVFVFAILNGLGILARTTTFLFYLAPCAALVLWGLWLALRAGNGAARRIALGRWCFHCVLTLVVSIGVFAPWYYRNIGFYYDFWVESHQGGQGGPLVRFNEDEARAPEALDKSSALAPPAPEPPHEFQAASSGLGLENVFPLLLQTLGQTAADNPLIAEKLLHPRVPWIRYPVHLLNNGLFLPLFLLSVAGILCACCNPKFRNSTVLVLLLCLLGSWVLLTVPIKYSNPRYALPAVPALVLFAAPAIFSIPHLWLRRTLAGITMVLLIVQYVHLSFVTLCGVHRADLAMNADPGIQGIFQDPGLVVFKDEMIISDAFSPVGHPVKENYVDRLFASLVRAEFQQPFVTGPYANFQRLNFRGLELHQRHYWPSEAGDAGEPPRPNPFLRPDLPPEQIPKRRLRSVGMGAEPEHLIPRLGITDYIVYAIEPKQVQEAKEQQWLKFFEENGFVLFDRFEVPAFGRVPQRTFGLMMRKPEGELIQITRTEDIDSLSLFDLHGFVHSPEFAELPADLKQHALARFEELVRPNQPFLVMNESVSLVKLSVGKAEEGWYEMRMLFKTTASIDKDYRVYFQGAPLDPQYLPEEKKGQGYIDWNFNPVPPTSEWKPDDYVLLRRRFEAHPVPYNFVVGFFQPPNTAFGQPAQTQMDLGRLSQ